jgi:hypothetical protein
MVMEASLEAALREVPEKLKKNTYKFQHVRTVIGKQNLPMIFQLTKLNCILHIQWHSRTYEDPE